MAGARIQDSFCSSGELQVWLRYCSLYNLSLMLLRVSSQTRSGISLFLEMPEMHCQCSFEDWKIQDLIITDR